jgi:hypothetical protein
MEVETVEPKRVLWHDGPGTHLSAVISGCGSGLPNSINLLQDAVIS